MNIPFSFKDFEDYSSIFDIQLMTQLSELDIVKKFQSIDNSGYSFLLPFVGSEYERKKVLIVAESKYVTLTTEDWECGLAFYNWMLDCLLQKEKKVAINDSILAFIKAHPQQLYTLEPFSEYYKYLNGKREQSCKSWPFLAIINVIKEKLNYTEEQALMSFAFSNFFLIPVICTSTYNGFNRTNYNKWISIRCKSRKEKRILWNTYTELCSMHLDTIIDTIKPELVLMVSTEAKKWYSGKYESKIVSLYHSSDNRWWYRVMKGTGKRCVDICGEQIEKLK